MTTKKQHFVPRFYLKNFSGTPKTIGMYNFKNSKIIKPSNLYNQCQKDFFYDSDNAIENHLSILERDAAELIRKIIQARSLSILTKDELYNLLFFVILQNSRTEVSSNKISQLGHLLLDEIVGEHDLDVKNGHIIAMQHSFMLTYIASDLKTALLVNKTKIPFITSDHPVSLTNPLFDRVNNKSLGGIGYAKKGLIITFPISSELCLIYYDYNSYFFGKGSLDIIITDINNINSINFLSASSCNENFYFDSLLQDDLIKNIVCNARWKNNKKYNSAKIEYTKKLSDDTVRSLLVSSSVPEYRNFSLNDVMKLNKKGKIFIKYSKENPDSINTKEGIREPNWVNIIHNFYNEVSQGIYEQHELYNYIEKK